MIETTVKITQRMEDILHFLTDGHFRDRILLPRLLFQSGVMRCEGYEPFHFVRNIDLINLNLQELTSKPNHSATSTNQPDSLSSHIVRLLQEIIVDGSQAIYHSQLSKISQIRNDDRRDRVSIDADLVPLGDQLITLNGNALFSADPKTRYEVGWEEINDNLQQFARWQEELDGDNDPGMALDIVQSKLLPLTVGILWKVASFLRFFTLDTRSDTPEWHDGYSDIDLIGNRLAVGGSLPPTTRDKANELDMLLFKLSKKVERLNSNMQELLSQPAQQIAGAQIPTTAKSNTKQKGIPGKPGPKGERTQSRLRRAEIARLDHDQIKDLNACAELKRKQIPLPSKKLQMIYKGDWSQYFRSENIAFRKQWNKDLKYKPVTSDNR